MRALIRWLFTMMKSLSLQSSEHADREETTKERKMYVLDLVTSQYNPLQAAAIKQEMWGLVQAEQGTATDNLLN